MRPVIIMWASRDENQAHRWTAHGFKRTAGDTLVLPDGATEFGVVNVSPNLARFDLEGEQSYDTVYGLGSATVKQYVDNGDSRKLQLQLQRTESGPVFATLSLTKDRQPE